MTAIDRAHEIMRSLPETSFVFLLDRQGRYLEVRTPPDPARLWMDVDAHIGKGLEEVLPPPLAIPRRFYFDLAVSSGAMQWYGYPHPTTEGRWMACQCIPILEDGVVERVIMRVYDIAEFTPLGSPYIHR